MAEQPMTSDDRARLKAAAQAAIERAEKATPPPWEERPTLIGHDHYHANSEIGGAPVFMHGRKVGGAVVCKLHSGFVWFEGDCKFIPAAREDVPHLAAALLAALEREELFRQALERIATFVDRPVSQAEAMIRNHIKTILNAADLPPPPPEEPHDHHE